MARNRKSPFCDPVREVTIKTPTGKVLRLLSNDLESSAQEIAELYKRRFAIELVFRSVKQTLKIRHFLGYSENAVRIQIAVALIAYLLLHMAKATQKIGYSPLAFARLVRTNLMHLRRTDTLIKPPPEPKIALRKRFLIGNRRDQSMWKFKPDCSGLVLGSTEHSAKARQSTCFVQHAHPARSVDPQDKPGDEDRSCLFAPVHAATFSLSPAIR